MSRRKNRRSRGRAPRSWKCCNKEGFKSWIDAEIRKSDVEAFYGEPMRVYRCPKGRYHLTTQNPNRKGARK